jgi:O-antigen ligase
MRAGIEMVLEHPLGIDGSRQSYEQLIQTQCHSIPMLEFAHTHNSWIDLSLALGWMGACLFASVLIYFIRRAVTLIYAHAQDSMSGVLLLLAGFWLVRGFFDSLYREHYLEMQAMLLIYLYGSIISDDQISS